jgi:hypothetical protein
MSKCFIEGVGGGGTGKLFAAIGVTYPEGSTLTCTDGTKTLKAKTTSGQWVFAVPYAGTWIVTATDGKETASKTVEITTEGQCASVVLEYRYYIIKDGELQNGYSFPNQMRSGVASNLSQGDGYIQISASTNKTCGRASNSKINCNNYSKICFDVTLGSGWFSPGVTVGLATSYGSSEENTVLGYVIYKAQTMDSNSRKVLEVDISSATTSYYIAMVVTPANTYSNSRIRAHNVWLE